MRSIIITIISIVGIHLVAQCSTASLVSIKNRSEGPSLTYMTYLSSKICDGKHFEKREQNYVIASRLYMVEQAGRQIIIKSFRGDIFKSSFQNIWTVIFWAGLFIGFLYIIVAVYHRSLLILKKNAYITIFDMPQQVKINKIIYFFLTMSFIVIIFIGIYGIDASLQSKIVVQDTICSLIMGNNNQIDHNILVKQGQGRSPFHADALYYQFRLLNIRQKSTQILRSTTFRSFFSDLSKYKIEINNTALSLIQNSYQDLTLSLHRLSNQTMMVQMLICYIRQKLENNRNLMIKMFRNIDSFIGKVEYLPGLISYWFTTIFFIAILGNLLLGCAYISYFLKREKMVKRLYQIGTNFLSFFIFIAFISLLSLITSQNLVYLNCLRMQDYRSKIMFEQYFKYYETYEEPVLRELMRKIQGHSSFNLQTAYHYDMQELSKESLAVFASFKEIYHSQQFVQAEKDLLELDKFKHLNANQTILSTNYKRIIQYLSECEDDLLNIFQLSPKSKASSILAYSFSQIRDYQDIMKEQICKKDLDLIFQINNFLFISIVAILVQLAIFSAFLKKMQISFIKIETDAKIEESTTEVKNSKEDIINQNENVTYFKNEQNQNDTL